jgi:hypothetical protein
MSARVAIRGFLAQNVRDSLLMTEFRLIPCWWQCGVIVSLLVQPQPLQLDPKLPSSGQIRRE